MLPAQFLLHSSFYEDLAPNLNTSSLSQTIPLFSTISTVDFLAHWTNIGSPPLRLLSRLLEHQSQNWKILIWSSNSLPYPLWDRFLRLTSWKQREFCHNFLCEPYRWLLSQTKACFRFQNYWSKNSWGSWSFMLFAIAKIDFPSTFLFTSLNKNCESSLNLIEGLQFHTELASLRPKAKADWFFL